MIQNCPPCNWPPFQLWISPGLQHLPNLYKQCACNYTAVTSVEMGQLGCWLMHKSTGLVGKSTNQKYPGTEYQEPGGINKDAHCTSSQDTKNQIKHFIALETFVHWLGKPFNQPSSWQWQWLSKSRSRGVRVEIMTRNGNHDNNPDCKAAGDDSWGIPLLTFCHRFDPHQYQAVARCWKDIPYMLSSSYDLDQDSVRKYTGR